MKILYIAHRVPYPPDKGDKIRSFHMIKHLSENHCIRLACLASSRQEVGKAEALRAYCDSIDVALMSPLRSKVRSFFHILSPNPLTLSYFDSKKLQALINRRLEEERFDLIFVFSSGMAQFVPRAQGVFKIIDFADVDSDKWFQYSKFVKTPLSHVYRLEGERLKRYEISLAPLYDCCTVISEAEERLFRSYSDRFVLCTIPNGVDVEYFQAKTRVSHQQSLIFMGAMDYYANVDGVLYFTHHILPLIQKAIPQVKFTILGGNPTRAIRKLGKSENVTITGYVPDVRPYLNESNVCVVPLRIARGVQNKILEAMAMGVPVVATDRAKEGINAQPGKHIMVADNPADFAAKTVELLLDHQLQQTISHNARQLVENEYRWRNCLQKLDMIVKTIAQRSP